MDFSFPDNGEGDERWGRRWWSIPTTCKCIIINSTYALPLSFPFLFSLSLFPSLSFPFNTIGNSTLRPIESSATLRVITGDAPKHRPHYLAHTTSVDIPWARRRWRKSQGDISRARKARVPRAHVDTWATRIVSELKLFVYNIYTHLKKYTFPVHSHIFLLISYKR